MLKTTHYKDGPALASIFSAGIGCAVIGLATILATADPKIKAILTWWDPAGPLTGKTGIGVIAWVLSWILLHLAWRKKEFPFQTFQRVWQIVLIFIVIGLLGTFPPIFELFEQGH